MDTIRIIDTEELTAFAYWAVVENGSPEVRNTDPSTMAPLSGPRGDRDVEFAALALPHVSAIARLAGMLEGGEADASGLVEETFLRAYRHWHTFSVGADCRRWLMAICRRTFFEHRTHERTITPTDDAELESLAAARLHTAAVESGLDHIFAQIDLGPAMTIALMSLEPHDRYALILVDIEGLSYEEAAEALEIPVGTVKSRVYRGRRKLQGSLLAHAADAGYATVRDRTGEATS